MMGNQVMAWTFPAGETKQVAIPATAGNVAYSLKPPSGKIWYVLWGRVTLVCDGNAANRRIRSAISDGTNTELELGFSATAITAGLTKHMNWHHGRTTGGSGAFYGRDLSGDDQSETSLPSPCILKGDDEITIDIVAGLAGDSYSGFFKVLEVAVGG